MHTNIKYKDLFEKVMKVGEHVWHLGCFSCQLCSHRFSHINQSQKMDDVKLEIFAIQMKNSDKELIYHQFKWHKMTKTKIKSIQVANINKTQTLSIKISNIDTKQNNQSKWTLLTDKKSIKIASIMTR